MIPTIKNVFYWGVAALALIALAGPLPDIATMLAILLIVGVLLTHMDDYVAIFNTSTANATTTTK